MKQIFREVLGIGLIRSVFLLGLVGLLGGVLFLGSQDNENAFYITAIFLGILVFIQVNRKDMFFLQTHFPKYRRIFQTEYILLTFPLAVCLLYHFKWLQLAVLIVGSLLISFVNYVPQKRSLNTKLQQIIPAEMYEWKAGSRRFLFFIVPLWLLGFFCSFFIGSVPVVLLILGISVLSLYETCEPYQMIVALEKSPHKFLMQKVRLQTLLFTSLVLPLLVVFVLFHTQYWYIVVFEYLLFISLHIFVIFCKYAYYRPNEKHLATQTINALGTLGVLIPVFLPVVWVFTVIFYFNAIKKLNYYLNDFH